MDVRVAKRAFDITIGAGLIAALLVPILVVGIAVRFSSPGPALYKTARRGLNGRPFTMLKFRTMKTTTSEEEARFRASVAKTGVLPKSAADARVTGLGRWLRKTSIDELPQLFNVVMGQMSLVGPRPVMPEMLANDPAFAQLRERVRPGITGQWQISSRAHNNSIESMREPDLKYVASLSLRGDLLIMLKTIAVVCKGHGAH